ncbi:hypothetical protein Ddc_14949 [Ditylenchus destructor]|nr:hypothetical protein Ddc_14949 [Ditylenchus destructor]
MFTTIIWPSGFSATNLIHRSSDSIYYGKEMTDELFFVVPTPYSSKPAPTSSNGTQTNIDDSGVMHRAILETIAAGLVDLADEFESDLVALSKQHNQHFRLSFLFSGGKSTVAAALVLNWAVSYLFTYNC